MSTFASAQKTSRVHTKDIKHDTRSRPVVPTADDVAITDDEDFRLSSYHSDAKELIVRHSESSPSV